MKAHAQAPRFRNTEIKFETYRVTELDGSVYTNSIMVCSYCGSVSIDDAIKAFQTPGTIWSGCDWKYGWPHKFYLQIPCEPRRRCTSKGPKETDLGYSEVKHDYHKFYSEHFVDATSEQLEQWEKIVRPITGIGFYLDPDGKLKYSALCGGHQGHGTIS